MDKFPLIGSFLLVLKIFSSCSKEFDPDTPLIVNSFTDFRDNQEYTTIVLGRQTWISENLNYDPGETSWVYDSIPSNGDIYGRLYGWRIINQVCPEGWHLPSDQEWKKLEKFLGMSKEDLDDYLIRCSGEVGKKLRTSWFPEDTETNLSGFGSLAGGRRLTAGEYIDIGKSVFFWTSSSIMVFSDFEGIFREIRKNCVYRSQVLGQSNDNSFFQSEAYSVRCLKDE